MKPTIGSAHIVPMTFGDKNKIVGDCFTVKLQGACEIVVVSLGAPKEEQLADAEFIASLFTMAGVCEKNGIDPQKAVKNLPELFQAVWAYVMAQHNTQVAIGRFGEAGRFKEMEEAKLTQMNKVFLDCNK